MLRRFLRRDFARQRHRLFGTASAARESIDSNVKNDNVVGKRKPRKITKAMVADFVDKYRAMNDGKFPSKRLTKKEVGGSYYTIWAILQDLEYNAKLHDKTSVDRTSVVRQTAGGSELSGVREVEIEISLHKTTETADTTEVGSGLQGKLGSCSGIVATPKGVTVFQKDAAYGRASELDVLARETNVANIENLGGGSQIPFVDTRDSSSSVRQADEVNEGQEGVECPSQVALETVPTDETVMARVMEDTKFLAAPGNPSQFSEGRKSELHGLDGKSAAQTSNTENIPRETTTEKTQDEQQESSVWGNLKLFASNIMKIWRNN